MIFAASTTDNLTAHIARGVSGALGFEGIDGFLEIIVRGVSPRFPLRAIDAGSIYEERRRYAGRYLYTNTKI